MLDAVLGILRGHPEVLLVEVQGHTDNVGLAASNRKLSQQRAEAVVRYLVSNGIEAERLVSKGFGPDKPIADNKKAAGRQQNRRVELLILKKKDAPKPPPPPAERAPPAAAAPPPASAPPPAAPPPPPASASSLLPHHPARTARPLPLLTD